MCELVVNDSDTEEETQTSKGHKRVTAVQHNNYSQVGLAKA